MTDEPKEFNFTEEQIEEQHQLLLEGIAFAEAWLEEGSDYEAFSQYSLKEQKLSRLLDPILWLLRDANLAYEHECDECAARIKAGGTTLGLAIADMLVREEENNGDQ